MPHEVLLAGSVRTAIGAFQGALADVGAARLASQAIRASLARAAAPPDRVDEVIVGNVLSAGLGQNVARQAALGAGLSNRVGATTVNKVCGSGLQSVICAVQAIQAGDAQVVVAGGTENMSQAPYLLPKARAGYRLGHGELIDSLIRDGLWDVYHDVHMGTCGDRCAERFSFTRQQQDDFAVASYQRALLARETGRLADEITPVEIERRAGKVVVDCDEELSRFDEAKLRALKPAFGKSGTVTAGNASSINDGAAAVVVLSSAAARELSVQPEARIVGHAGAAHEPEWFTTAPVGAIDRLLRKVGWSIGDVDLFEINEAFAVVPLVVMSELGVPHAQVNVRGGAVALGHPIGASGTRILVTLLKSLAQHGLRRGVAAICIGGGEALAIAVERC